MGIRHGIVATAMVVALAPAGVRADGIQGRWSIGLQGGTDLELSGNVHEGVSGTVLGLATAVQAKSFSDVYNPSLRGQLSVRYGIGAQSELLLRGSYYKLSADTLQVGTVAGLALNAGFAEYKEWGVEAGLRRYLTSGRFKPYVGLVAGVRSLAVDPQRPGRRRRLLDAIASWGGPGPRLRSSLASLSSIAARPRPLPGG